MQRLLTLDYQLQDRLAALKAEVHRLAQEKRRKRIEDEKERILNDGGEKLSRTVAVPARATSVDQLAEIVGRIESIKAEWSLYTELEVNFTIEEP
jgi:transcription initiation factor TFIIIB Brf1 subunit/transcription initiation factor TFIIB